MVRAPALHAGGRGFKSLTTHIAGVTQLAEYKISNLDVVGSTPITRFIKMCVALVVEWYTRQSQKLLPLRDCEFESHREHLYGI